jgi:outer membrane biosynthesis protein TonB
MSLQSIFVVNTAPGCDNFIQQQISADTCNSYIIRITPNTNALGPFDVYVSTYPDPLSAATLYYSAQTRTEMLNGVVVQLGPCVTPTPTLTPTPATPTPTPTNTETPTETPTNTPTPTPTNTETPTPSVTAGLTPTPTGSNTPTPTETPTQTPTNTETQTPTNTETPTQTPTETPTQTQTPTNTETPTPTNTETPTQTPTPSRLYWEYSLGYDATIATNACDDYFISPTNFYSAPGDGPGPNIGETLYTDSALTTPAPDGYYSNGVAWYQVTGGAGLITSADPNGCAISPTPTPTNTETPTPTNTSTPTPTQTNTSTPTPTPTSVLEILIFTQEGNQLITQDGNLLILQEDSTAYTVSSGDTISVCTAGAGSYTLSQTIYSPTNDWYSVVRFFSDSSLNTPFNGNDLYYTNSLDGCGSFWKIDSGGFTTDNCNPC